MFRINRLFVLLVFTISLFGPAPWAQPAAAKPAALPVATANPSAAAQASLEESTAEQIVLRFQAPVYQLNTSQLEGRTYTQIEVPGAVNLGSPGQIQLPVMSVLVGVPAGVDFELVVLQDQPQEISAPLPPAPALQPARIEADFEAGAWEQAALTDIQTAGVYPSQPAKIADEAWLRSQRLVRVEFYPFQYDAASQTLIWHADVRLALRFKGTQPAARSGSALILEDADFETYLQANLINYAQALEWRSATPPANLPPALFNAAPESALRISVLEDGLYRITYADLLTAGFPLPLNPALLQLTSQGQPVAYQFEGDTDAALEPGEAIVFYGEKLRGERLESLYTQSMKNWLYLCSQCRLKGLFEKYTNENVYWLAVGTKLGLRMNVVDSTPTDTAQVPAAYREKIRFEQETAWYSYHFTSEDTWFWSRMQPGPVTKTFSFNFPLSALASNGSDISLGGSMVSRNPTPNHHTTVSINSYPTPVDDTVWHNASRLDFVESMPASALLEGNNTLKIKIDYNGTYIEDIYFDYLEVAFDRQYVAQNNALWFASQAAGTWQYEVGELTSSQALAFDITDPIQPLLLTNLRVTPLNTAYQAAFQLFHAANRRLLVVGADAVRTPASLKYIQPADLSPAGGVDYIFITHSDFMTATQLLADYRGSLGLSTLVVDVEQVYNQYNFGIYHPVAIRNYLADAFASWIVKPRYALLVGDGNFNLKSFSLAAYPPEPIYMPPNLAFVDPWQGETESLTLLGAVAGTDFLPDVQLGRVQARTVAEMLAVVAKTIAYEQEPLQANSWQQRAIFVADNIPDSAGDFEASSNRLANLYLPDGFTAEKIYIGAADLCGPPTSTPQACPPARERIVSSLNNQGALILNYIGHGARGRWANEQVFRNAEVAALTNGSKLPIVLSWTCLDGYWLYPSSQSMIEDLLRAADKGVVAAFSPTGLGVATGHDRLADGFYKTLFSGGSWHLGTAAQNAKLELFAAGYSYDLIFTFGIFGDPALSLKSPYDLSADTHAQTQSAYSGEVVTYTLPITNTGALTDTFDLALLGADWPVTFSQQSVTLAPGAAAVLQAFVTVPFDLSTGTQDQAIWKVASRGDSSLQALTPLTTSARFVLRLTAAEKAQVTPAGETVTYTLRLTNTTATAETYQIKLEGQQWATNLSSAGVQLEAGQAADLQVWVQAPADAANYAEDTVLVWATPQSNSQYPAQISLTTTARQRSVLLSAGQISQAGWNGSTLTYVLTLRNTGGFPDSLALTLQNNDWAASLQPVGPWALPAGASLEVQVQVQIPMWSAQTQDAMTVTLYSQADPSKTSQVILTSQLDGYQIHLPLTRK